ncbi:DUF2971 domain-containing protein [Terriglobus albidus]|uniref:DUF2971 domain-containing protein n=1 Tax=Terriglobus albidus TaxID=1592106 RepID=UPI0021E033BA|nr:DUF2971 domain-containing protein [Terriglobus albidus]
MSKRVYKFTRATHAISSLNEKRLKLSTIADLNDPFDLCPLDTTDPEISEAVDIVTVNFWKTTGILCFSRNWDNLLLWSHYGDSHKGICLGFDISDDDPDGNYDTDVHYQPNLLQIRRPEDVLDVANRLPRTKHESWSYEQEVRMFVDLGDPPDANGLHWIEFSPHLVLKEVIIGAQCSPIDSRKVEESVKPYGDAVKCWWAGMRRDAFLLIKEDHPPYWHAIVSRR